MYEGIVRLELEKDVLDPTGYGVCMPDEDLCFECILISAYSASILEAVSILMKI